MALEELSCQKCESLLISRLFCFSCNAFQPFTSEIDYFQAMGLPIGFEINYEDLEERYQRLSLVMHPDFFEAASEADKHLSEKASVMLNTAYNTLRESTSRARYLLFLFAKGKNLNDKTLPDGLLKEMFFLQESLDELLESGDVTALSKMNEDLRCRYKDIESNYAPLFKKFEGSPEDSEILQQLQTHLNVERYLRRLLDRIQTND